MAEAGRPFHQGTANDLPDGGWRPGIHGGSALDAAEFPAAIANERTDGVTFRPDATLAVRVGRHAGRAQPIEAVRDDLDVFNKTITKGSGRQPARGKPAASTRRHPQSGRLNKTEAATFTPAKVQLR